jgi:hypothetical protein
VVHQCVINLVVMRLHILVGPCWYVALSTSEQCNIHTIITIKNFYKKSYFTTTDQMQYMYIYIHSFIQFILFILNFDFEGGEKTCKGLAVR